MYASIAQYLISLGIFLYIMGIDKDNPKLKPLKGYGFAVAVTSIPFMIAAIFGQ